MQTERQGNMRNSYLTPPNSHRVIFGNVVTALVVVFTAFFFTSCTSNAINIATYTRDATKRINIAVGAPITTDSAIRALNLVEHIPYLTYTIDRYNERFGNDSVYALIFVDKDPDEKADDPLVKNYFNVIVVSDSANHVSRWFSFDVRKDYQEVLYYDFNKSKTAPLDEWKLIWPASEFLGKRD